jgi:hypothetical protein
MKTSHRSLLTMSHQSLHKLCLATLATSLLAGSSFAFQSATQYQLGERQGSLAVSPAGLTVSSSTTSSVLVRAAGAPAAAPTEWSTTRFGATASNYPDFSDSAYLLGLNRSLATGASAISAIEFSGISTGGDVCGAIATDGRMSVAGWYALSITLDRKSPGQVYGNPGSTLRSLNNAPGSVVSHYFAGSTGIDSALINSTIVEQTDRQMGFAAGSDVDIDAMDWGMGAIAGDRTGLRTAEIAPVRDRFYFAVDSASVLANTNYTSEVGGVTLSLRTDTIYAMDWTAQAAPEAWGWSAPYVAYSATELFGTSNPSPPIEIDAISVYRLANSTTDRVVFSAKGDRLDDQIMGYDSFNFAPVTLAQPLKDGAGDLISGKFGIADMTGTEPDDVDSICPIDPEAFIYNGALGTPAQVLDATDGQFGLSMYRYIELTGVSSTGGGGGGSGAPSYYDHLTMQATGLPVSKDNGIVLFEFALLTPSQTLWPISSASILSWNYIGAAMQAVNATTATFTAMGNMPIVAPMAVRATHFPKAGSPADGVSHLSILKY